MLKHEAILYNETEVFSLSITNPNGRPMLPFDWLIHSSLILARCHKILDSVFLPVFICKKIQTDCEGHVIWLFFGQLSKRDSVRSTIAAVVLLQLKFSPPLTNVTSCFMAFSLESSYLTSILRRNLTLPMFKFCCFFVVLFFPISLL